MVPPLSFCECVAKLVVKVENKQEVEEELNRVIDEIFFKGVPVLRSNVSSLSAVDVKQEELNDAEAIRKLRGSA